MMDLEGTTVVEIDTMDLDSALVEALVVDGSADAFALPRPLLSPVNLLSFLVSDL